MSQGVLPSGKGGMRNSSAIGVRIGCFLAASGRTIGETSFTLSSLRQGRGARPAARLMRINSDRLRAPILSMTRARWISTVRGLIARS